MEIGAYKSMLPNLEMRRLVYGNIIRDGKSVSPDCACGICDCMCSCSQCMGREYIGKEPTGVIDREYLVNESA